MIFLSSINSIWNIDNLDLVQLTLALSDTQRVYELKRFFSCKSVQPKKIVTPVERASTVLFVYKIKQTRLAGI